MLQKLPTGRQREKHASCVCCVPLAFALGPAEFFMRSGSTRILCPWGIANAMGRQGPMVSTKTAYTAPARRCSRIASARSTALQALRVQRVKLLRFRMAASRAFGQAPGPCVTALATQLQIRPITPSLKRPFGKLCSCWSHIRESKQ